MSSMIEKLCIPPLERALNRLDPKQMATLEGLIYAASVYLLLHSIYKNQWTLLGLSIVIWFFVVVGLTRILVRSHYEYTTCITCRNCGEVLDLLKSPLKMILPGSSNQPWTFQAKNGFNVWLPFLSLAWPERCPACDEPVNAEVDSLGGFVGRLLQGGVVGSAGYVIIIYSILTIITW